MPKKSRDPQAISRPRQGVATTSRRYYPALDGLRGVAAVAVVVFHAFSHSGLPLFPRGYLAVDFFYVLSGFVIYDAYGTKPIGASQFVLQRIVRLYPVILLSTALVAILTAGHADPADLIRQALVVPNLETQGVFPENGPMWSMASEIMANLVFFVILRSAAPKIVALICVLGLCLLSVAVYKIHTMNFGADSSTFVEGLSRISFFFPLGILIHHIASRVRVPAWPLPAATLLLLCMLSVPHITHGDALIDLGLACSLVPLCLAVSLNTDVNGPILRWCKNLGLLSYPLYLVHWPIMTTFNPRLEVSPGLAAVMVAVSLLAGICATWLFDKPVRQWLARVVNRRARIPVHAR